MLNIKNKNNRVKESILPASQLAQNAANNFSKQNKGVNSVNRASYQQNDSQIIPEKQSLFSLDSQLTSKQIQLNLHHQDQQENSVEQKKETLPEITNKHNNQKTLINCLSSFIILFALIKLISIISYNDQPRSAPLLTFCIILILAQAISLSILNNQKLFQIFCKNNNHSKQCILLVFCNWIISMLLVFEINTFQFQNQSPPGQAASKYAFIIINIVQSSQQIRFSFVVFWTILMISILSMLFLQLLPTFQMKLIGNIGMFIYFAIRMDFFANISFQNPETIQSILLFVFIQAREVGKFSFIKNAFFKIIALNFKQQKSSYDKSKSVQQDALKNQPNNGLPLKVEVNQVPIKLQENENTNYTNLDNVKNINPNLFERINEQVRNNQFENDRLRSDDPNDIYIDISMSQDNDKMKQEECVNKQQKEQKEQQQQQQQQYNPMPLDQLSILEQESGNRALKYNSMEQIAIKKNHINVQKKKFRKSIFQQLTPVETVTNKTAMQFSEPNNGNGMIDALDLLQEGIAIIGQDLKLVYKNKVAGMILDESYDDAFIRTMLSLKTHVYSHFQNDQHLLLKSENTDTMRSAYYETSTLQKELKLRRSSKKDPSIISNANPQQLSGSSLENNGNGNVAVSQQNQNQQKDIQIQVEIQSNVKNDTSFSQQPPKSPDLGEGYFLQENERKRHCQTLRNLSSYDNVEKIVHFLVEHFKECVDLHNQNQNDSIDCSTPYDLQKHHLSKSLKNVSMVSMPNMGSIISSTNKYGSFSLSDLTNDMTIDNKENTIMLFYEKNDRNHSNQILSLNFKPVKHTVQQKVSLSILIIISDVTNQPWVSMIEEKDLFKSRILKSISHEIYTPLNISMNMMQILQESLPQAVLSQQKKYIQPIVCSLDFMHCIINDILDFSNIGDDANFQMKLECFDLKQLLEKTIMMFNLQAKSRNTTIFLKCGLNGKKIVSDRMKIKQIMVNLISNSIRYSNSDGQIVINANFRGQTEERVLISVRDTGSGMSKEQIEQLGQISISNSQLIGGLGLTISNHLAMMLAPKPNKRGLMVKSVQNVGTLFAFTLKNHAHDTAQQQIHMYEEIVLDQYEKSILDQRQQILSQIQNSESVSYEKYSQNSDQQMTPFQQIANLNKQINKHNFIQQKNQKQQQQQNNNSIEMQMQIDQQKQKEKQKQRKIAYFSSPEFISLKAKVSKLDQESIKSHLLRMQNCKSCECTQILMVDDQDFNLLVLKTMLLKYNFKIETAVNGQVAIDEARRITKDQANCCPLGIILMDLDMPIKTGFEAAQEIRNLGLQMPIVAVSAFTGKEYEDKAIQSGMQGYLNKPVNRDLLEQTLLSYFIDINELNCYNNN